MQRLNFKSPWCQCRKTSRSQYKPSWWVHWPRTVDHLLMATISFQMFNGNKEVWKWLLWSSDWSLHLLIRVRPEIGASATFDSHSQHLRWNANQEFKWYVFKILRMVRRTTQLTSRSPSVKYCGVVFLNALQTQYLIDGYMHSKKSAMIDWHARTHGTLASARSIRAINPLFMLGSSSVI